MRVIVSLALTAMLCCGMASIGQAQEDQVIYVPMHRDSVNELLRERADSLQDIQDSITGAIRDAQEKYDEMQRDSAKSLRFEFADVVIPESPEVFKAQFHFPPIRQYVTGTCWCFSTTSFLESEVYRLTGQKIKLSEMYTVYNEYLEKARYFVRTRGETWPGQGSEDNAVTRMIKLYGAVPAEAFPGYIDDSRHDHSRLSKEVRTYLDYVNDNDFWNEEAVLNHVRLILNQYLGTPPETITYDGKKMTPVEFVTDVLRLHPDDNLNVMSTLSIPFYTQGPLDVPDNWWHDSSYYNVPLDEWYELIVGAIDDGFTLVIGGDNSEPGWNGFEDACIIPDFDIPQDYINQDSREYRFHYGMTTDDHGIHLVGHTKIDDHDWFLIKDSGSSGHWGQFKGYYFMRDDYVRLKMLAFTVHKDALKDILHKFADSH